MWLTIKFVVFYIIVKLFYSNRYHSVGRYLTSEIRLIKIDSFLILAKFSSYSHKNIRNKNDSGFFWLPSNATAIHLIKLKWIFFAVFKFLR